MWYTLRMEIILFFQSTTQKSWRQKLSGVHSFAQERGWFVQVIDRYATAAEVRRALDEWHPAGCLVDRAMSKGAPPDILFRDIPTVYLDQTPRRPSRMHPCLLHDSAAEAALAGGELLRLKCASYAYIGLGAGIHWDEDRLAQFRKDASRAGRSVAVLPSVRLKDAIAKLPKPCGIMGANDKCAAMAFNAAVSAGLSIPDEVAIAGVDNDELLCESVSPGLTSAEPDFEGAGYRLARMLADEIDRAHSRGRRAAKANGAPRVENYGPLRLVRRGSTAAPSTASPRVRRALEFIRRNACERSIKLDDVVAEMKCSRRLGTMLFRKETGHSILDEIHDRRFEKACDLLKRTRLPIAAVVAQCGYMSDSFVKKMFLARTGLTMRGYRAQQNRN